MWFRGVATPYTLAALRQGFLRAPADFALMQNFPRCFPRYTSTNSSYGRKNSADFLANYKAFDTAQYYALAGYIYIF
jgi:hypothetical protein